MPSHAQCQPSDYQLKYSSTLGFVLQLLYATSRKSFSIASISLQVQPAIQLEQIEVCHDWRGNPVGYATWAYVTDEVADELCRDGDRLLHFSEWNEGLNVWIIDFVAPHGHARMLARQLGRGPLARAARVRGVRQNSNGGIRRVADLHLSRTPHLVDA
jgi:hemolysin-activating ACP:hemolysin acyltransferase